MDLGPHQLRDRRVDQLVALRAVAPGEALRDHGDGKMPPLTGPGMAGMLRAVVADLQRQRMQARGERLTQFGDALGTHVVASRGRWRASQATCAAANTSVAPVNPKSLKFTQARSLALNATSRLAQPSSP